MRPPRDIRNIDGREPGTKDPVAPKGSPAQPQRLLTLKDAAVVLGTSTATVRRLVSAGKLPMVRLTRRIQIDMRDLERLVEQAKDRSTRWTD
jgi:excisionase family DNA binding protein